MTRGTIATGAPVIAFLGAMTLAYFVITQILDPAVPPSTAITPDVASAVAHPSFLYGRITTDSGTTYEGRLRWGRDEEAFWGDYFDGVKTENAWATYVPPERLSTEPRPVEIFGMEVTKKREPIDLRRLFLARFGDIARIERMHRDVRVTLKSGTVTTLDYNEANDFGDGVRVWDLTRGVVDLDAFADCSHRHSSRATGRPSS